jgi:hypothetical protein
MEPIATGHAMNHKATTVMVMTLIGRSFGLAAGIAVIIVLASALFAR